MQVGRAHGGEGRLVSRLERGLLLMRLPSSAEAMCGGEGGLLENRLRWGDTVCDHESRLIRRLEARITS
jgi:hypothetical protein